MWRGKRKESGKYGRWRDWRGTMAEEDLDVLQDEIRRIQRLDFIRSKIRYRFGGE